MTLEMCSNEPVFVFTFPAVDPNLSNYNTQLRFPWNLYTYKT